VAQTSEAEDFRRTLRDLKILTNRVEREEVLILLFLSLTPDAVGAEAVMDLRAWDGEVSALDGEWSFLPGSIAPRWTEQPLPEDAAPLTVPGDWTDRQEPLGVGTYAINLVLPEEPQELVFWLKYSGSAYSLTLDGEPLLSRGVTGETFETTDPSWGPARTHRVLSGEHRLVMQIANFHRPVGFQHSIHIGGPGPMERWLLKRGLINFVLVGGLFLIGMYHLGLWVLRREERASFWFAALCAIATTRSLCMEQVPWQLGFESLDGPSIRLGLLTLAVFPATGLAYVESNFPDDRYRTLQKALWVFSALITAPLLFLPLAGALHMLPVLQVVVLGIFAVFLVKGISDIRSNAPRSRRFYGSLAPVFVGAVNDILVFDHLVPWEVELAPAGLLVWFLYQVGSLLSRNVEAHQTVNQINELLTYAVEERTGELRRAVEDARDAASVKLQFLANMSHEIRTPMNGVLGSAQLLGRTDLSHHQRAYVSTILQSGEVLTTVLNDVLDLSQLEGGQLELEQRAFHPSEITRWAEALFSEQAARRELTLSVSAQPELPSVSGDDIRLRQVLANLVSNALKFTEHGEVHVRLTEEERRDDVSVLRFEVRDTGVGVAQEDLDGLLQPFSQANSSTTRHHGGSGLGLAICARLINLMDGEIGAESAPRSDGRAPGSTFWFTCPLPVDTTVAAPTAAAVSRSLVGCRMLVVEDNIVNQRVILHMLAATGAEITLATQGAEGVEYFQEDGPFDVVLMDCQMPVMDGFEATRRIRDLPGGDLPILAVTASALEEDRRRVLAAGMDDIVPKPLNLDVLLAAISVALERRDAIKESA